MVQRVFENFVEGIRASGDANALRSTAAKGLAALGFDRFAYFVLSKPHAEAGELISTYPRAWLDRYAEQQFEWIDPVIQCVRDGDAPFAWDRLPQNPTSAQRRLFESANLPDGSGGPSRLSRSAKAANGGSMSSN